MTTSDHDDRMELPTGARYERLRLIALAAEHDDQMTTGKLLDRLGEVPASWDEFEAVREDMHGGTDSASDPEGIDYERTVLRHLSTERRAVAATDKWLAEAHHRDPNFDWDAVAKLAGLDAGFLKRRAGAPVSGEAGLPRVNVRGGVTVNDAVGLLDVSRGTIFNMIRDGRLRHTVIDGRKVIAADAEGRPIVYPRES